MLFKEPDSTSYCVHTASLQSGRTSASHAGGRGVEPRREQFFFVSVLPHTVAKYSWVPMGTKFLKYYSTRAVTCTASVLKLRRSGLAATLNFLFLSVLLKTDDFSPSLHCKWLNGVKMRLSFILCVRQICTRIKFTYYLRGSEYAVIMRRFQI